MPPDTTNRSGTTTVAVPALDSPTRLQCLLCLSQAGFRGDHDSRILSSVEEMLHGYVETEEVS